MTYRNLTVELDRNLGAAHLIVRGPESAPAPDLVALKRLDDSFWPLAMARELDDAILYLRFNEERIGTWVFHTQGDGRLIERYNRLLLKNVDNWLIREVIHYLKRVLKRLEVSSRSMFALVEPGSCFTGVLLELALAADRAYMLNGTREGREEKPARIRLTGMNFGPLPKCNGLARLENRFLGEPAHLEELRALATRELDAESAAELGLVLLFLMK